MGSDYWLRGEGKPYPQLVFVSKESGYGDGC